MSLSLVEELYSSHSMVVLEKKNISPASDAAYAIATALIYRICQLLFFEVQTFEYGSKLAPQ